MTGTCWRDTKGSTRNEPNGRARLLIRFRPGGFGRGGCGRIRGLRVDVGGVFEIFEFRAGAEVVALDGIDAALEAVEDLVAVVEDPAGGELRLAEGQVGHRRVLAISGLVSAENCVRLAVTAWGWRVRVPGASRKCVRTLGPPLLASRIRLGDGPVESWMNNGRWQAQRAQVYLPP
jgi:hypothetical protein